MPATWAFAGWPARMVLTGLRCLPLLFSVVRPKSGHLGEGLLWSCIRPTCSLRAEDSLSVNGRPADSEGAGQGSRRPTPGTDLLSSRESVGIRRSGHCSFPPARDYGDSEIVAAGHLTL